VPLTSWSFRRSRLNGTLIPARAPIGSRPPDGTALATPLHAPDNGGRGRDLLYVQSRGGRTPTEVLERLARGEDVERQRYTFPHFDLESRPRRPTSTG